MVKADNSKISPTYRVAAVTLTICAGALLSGCIWSTPPLASFQPPPQSPPSDVGPILQTAYNLQRTYEGNYKKSAKADQIGQLPLIGLGAAAAFVLFNNNTNAASEAGKIGIAAGTYSAARGLFTGTGLADFYLKGHGALTCVLQEGILFSGASAANRRNVLSARLQSVADAIGQLELDAAKEVKPVSNPALVDATRKLAAETVEAARTVEQASLIDSAAFDTGASVFMGAVSSISVRVATKARVRPDTSFAAVRDSLTAAAKAPDPKAITQGSPSVGQALWMLSVIASNAKLRSETARLKAETPGYVASLGRVAKCPDLV